MKVGLLGCAPLRFAPLEIRPLTFAKVGPLRSGSPE